MLDFTLILNALHQAFEKMHMRFEEIERQLKKHGAAIKSILKEQTSRESNRAIHNDTKYKKKK